jgi:hypothetical protein
VKRSCISFPFSEDKCKVPIFTLAAMSSGEIGPTSPRRKSLAGASCGCQALSQLQAAGTVGGRKQC